MPLKGLRLLVRPAAAEDETAVRQLDSITARWAFDASRNDFVGKLIGEVVALAIARRHADQLQIEELFVRSDLRGKRVATVLLREIAAWSEAHDVIGLTVRNGALPERFLERAGFKRIGDVFVRNID